MARAKAQGTQLGRKRIPEDVQEEIKRLRTQTPPVSIKQISKRLGIPYGTAWRYVKMLEGR